MIFFPPGFTNVFGNELQGHIEFTHSEKSRAGNKRKIAGQTGNEHSEEQFLCSIFRVIYSLKFFNHQMLLNTSVL